VEIINAKRRTNKQNKVERVDRLASYRSLNSNSSTGEGENWNFVRLVLSDGFLFLRFACVFQLVSFVCLFATHRPVSMADPDAGNKDAVSLLQPSIVTNDKKNPKTITAD
jgi:hypothetical protein